MPLTSRSGGGGLCSILVSEEDLDDLRILERVRQAALEDLLAGIHDDDAVGDLIDEAHQMLDDERAQCRSAPAP